ncbi:MAG: hypothetical protein COA79_04640 [Planctomycetota bacterium]|nr:MAG: hypothetical protein COA79_04640 [Planctomycetota bacterium]
MNNFLAKFSLYLILSATLFIQNSAQEKEKKPIEVLDEKLKKLSDVSTQLNIDYLLQVVDPDQGLWIVPKIGKSVVWEKTGVFKDVKVPITKVVGHKEVWRWVSQPTDEDPYRKVYKKVKKAIYKVVGHKTVKREISKPTDKNSSMSQANKRYIEGMNSMVAYALLEAGIILEADPTITKYFDFIGEIIDFGYSDNTIELCLEILVLIKTDSPKYKRDIAKGLHKLLNGQLTSGKSKGLWGYYSINWKNIPMINAQIQRLETHISKIRLPKNIDKGKKLSKTDQIKLDRLNELKTGKGWLEKYQRSVTREFTVGRTWFKNRKITGMPGDNDLKRYIYWPGTLFDAREERLGSLLATQFALWTLNEANKEGYFSKEGKKIFKDLTSLRLRKNKTILHAPPTPKMSTLLNNTMVYLQKNQQKDGTWIEDEVVTKVKRHPFPEMKNHIAKFDPRNYGKKVKKIEYTPLPKLFKATTSAMHCLALIASIQGKNAIVKSRYSRVIKAGLPHYQKFITEMLAGSDLIKDTLTSYYPYNLLITLPDVHEQLGTDLMSKPDGLSKILTFAYKLENEAGNYNEDYKKYFQNRFQPHPLFPITTEDKWIKEKIFTGYWEHGEASPLLISTSIMILFTKRIRNMSIEHKRNWPNAFEEFSKLREELFQIPPTLYNQIQADAKAAKLEEEQKKIEAEVAKKKAEEEKKKAEEDKKEDGEKKAPEEKPEDEVKLPF